MTWPARSHRLGICLYPPVFFRVLGSIEIEARGTGGSDGAFGTWRNGSVAETESALSGAFAVDVDRAGAVPDGLPARRTHHHAGRLALLTCQLECQSPHQLPKSETHGQEAGGRGFNLGG